MSSNLFMSFDISLLLVGISGKIWKRIVIFMTKIKTFYIKIHIRTYWLLLLEENSRKKKVVVKFSLHLIAESNQGCWVEKTLIGFLCRKVSVYHKNSNTPIRKVKDLTLSSLCWKNPKGLIDVSTLVFLSFSRRRLQSQEGFEVLVPYSLKWKSSL